MARAGTREKILKTAERLFARDGFDGTTMRRIAAKATVNLAAMHYHFGSKEALFDAVIQRRQVPMDEQRLQALDELETQAQGRPIDLESLIGALIEPLLEFARNGGRGQDWLRLLMRLRIEDWQRRVGSGELHQKMFHRYVDAFRKALPDRHRGP